MGEYIREVVKDLELGMACSCCQNPATWYEYTRHTYACQYMLAGGTIEDLSRTLGHSSTAITEKHYVHLRRDYYRSASLSLMVTDFSLKAKSDKEPDGSPKVQLGPKLGPQAFFEEQKKEAN
jgi:hypothetical protein